MNQRQAAAATDAAQELADRWAALLAALRDRGAYRTLRQPGGVDLSSNDYLGYARLPPAEPAGAERFGCLERCRSGTASRLLRGHHPVWDEVERQLADWHGAEAAVMFTSGYVANEGLLSTVVERVDWVASDQLNHASIIDGLRLSRAERFVYRHGDLEHLEQGLRAAAASRPADRQLFIVTESLFGMDGDVAPLADLAWLADRYGAHLIVDEAHATGCYGPSGGGLVDRCGLRDRLLATVHTGGKALAVCGAYVCGSRRLKELLINRCRHLIYTTALPPVVGGWWLAALGRVRADQSGRTALHQAAGHFRRQLQQYGLKPTGTEYVVSLVAGENTAAWQWAELMQQRGWDVRAIRTPTVPAGSARLRLSVHANHALELLSRVAADLAQTWSMVR